jgi:hypothetical protein
MSAMSAHARLLTAAAAAGLAMLAGCGSTPASQPGPGPTAHASTTPSAPAATPSAGATPAGAPPACPQPGSYLTGIRVGQHAGYDRVVFQFSGGLPAYGAEYVRAVYADPKGTVVPLPGQAYFRVVFRGASATCAPTASRTYAGPSVLTPYGPQLLAVSAAGDFEGYLSFGIGLAARGSYHVWSLTAPDRVVIDFSHVTLARFPGIWDITSWPQYWSAQYAWLNGHQPWLSNPEMVVQAWAYGRWPGTAPVITQVNADTFRVTEPGGRVDTVIGTRPVTTPGPWVITTIVPGALPA